MAATQVQKEFNTDEQETWRTILTEHKLKRRQQVVEIFHSGLEQLNITAEQIPSINEVNEHLCKLTGWQGVLVSGLEDGKNFYQFLAKKRFPVGHFIRDKEDLTYTPEPDIVHDLYGHLPFLTDKDYANFCHRFGQMACDFIDEPHLLKQFERLFWFTIEFGLIKTPNGVRVFGAGIASSTAECVYALSDKPEVVNFDLDAIRAQDFRIDEMQKKLFLLESTDQLYGCLDDFYAKVLKDRVKHD